MREYLVHKYFKFMKISTEPPVGTPGRLLEHVYQPAVRSDYPAMAWWMFTQCLAVFALLLFTLKPSWPWLPEFLVSRYEAIENILFYNPLKWVVDWDFRFPYLGILGIAIEFLLTAPVFLLQLNIRTKHYFVDAKGLGSREGRFTVTTKYTHWSSVQSITLKRGPIQNLLGLSNIEILTAGGDKATDVANQRAIIFRNLEDGNSIYTMLMERLEAAKEEADAGQSDTVPADEESAALGLLEEVKRLRRQLAGPTEQS